MPKEKSEGIYVISLKRVYWSGRAMRGRKAIKFIRRFLMRHLGAERVILDRTINEYIHSRSIKSPPRRIAVKFMKIDEGVYKATLAIPTEVG